MKISITDNKEIHLNQKKVILQIRDLVNLRNFERGDKLPSERLMSEKFNINRNQVREAIRKLEFYGVLRSVAQSGTIMAIGLIGFNALVEEIVALEKPTFKDLVETRITLEMKTVCLAAENRSYEDLSRISDALRAFEDKLLNGKAYLEEDLRFHIEVAKASKNNAMLNLMLLITPPILVHYKRDEVCEGDTVQDEIIKHENVYVAIANQDVGLARSAMKEHFFKLMQYAERN